MQPEIGDVVWAEAEDYQRVQDLYRILRVGPYAPFSRLGLLDFAWEQRWWGAVALMALLWWSIHVARVSHLLRKRTAELQHAHEQARLRGERMEHTVRLSLLGEMASSLAHEINQPLGAILANADAAEILLESGGAPPGELREIVADIKKQDLRAGEVIRRVRSLARRRELRRAPLDPNEVVEEAVELLAGETRRRRVHVDLALAAGIPAVAGDRVALEQVLVNLVLNACEAMASAPEERRRLSVSTSVGPGPSVLVSVADGGPGIPPEAMPRLFDSFFTTKEEGLGLGLSIARSILEAHGGTLRAANREPHGAVFTAELPLPEGR